MNRGSLCAFFALAALLPACGDDEPTEPEATYTVGGTAQNVPEGGIVIALNAIDLAIPGNGPWTHPTRLTDGLAWMITMVDQGPTRCLASPFEGTIEGADVTDVVVACDPVVQ